MNDPNTRPFWIVARLLIKIENRGTSPATLAMIRKSGTGFPKRSRANDKLKRDCVPTDAIAF